MRVHITLDEADVKRLDARVGARRRRGSTATAGAYARSSVRTASTRRCESGVSSSPSLPRIAVILAGSAALAAWEAAAAPVVEDLAQDPATAAAIEAIAALETTTPRSPAVAACGPAPVASMAPSDLTGFRATLPPDGTYRIAPTVEDLIAAGASKQFAGPNAQTWTLRIAGETWTGEGRTGSQTATCSGTSTPVEGSVRMSTVLDGGCGWDYDIVWREAENGIELRVLAVGGDPEYPDIASERALDERVWVRIDG